MNDIDVAKQVAKDAGRQIAELKQKVAKDKDVHISILKDCLDDLRAQNKFIKNIVWWLCGIILLLIISLVGQSIYSQERLVNFLSDYEFESVIESNLNNEESPDGHNYLNINKGK